MCSSSLLYGVLRSGSTVESPVSYFVTVCVLECCILFSGPSEEVGDPSEKDDASSPKVDVKCLK